MKSRALLTIALVTMVPMLAAGPRPQASSRKDKPVGEGKDKPKLSLVANPAVGFTPVSVTLTGHLTGVDLHDRNFCHAAVTWIRIDPGQTEREGSKEREAPACLHPDEEISVEDTFSKTFALYLPGSYLFRLEIEAKDGTRVVSGYARAQVLRIQ